MENNEVRKECEEWISHFVSIDEKLRKIVESSDDEKINIRFTVRNLFTLCMPDPTGKTLELAVYHANDIYPTVRGAELCLNNYNDDVFKYLFAWAFDYYLSNYHNYEINEQGTIEEVIRNLCSDVNYSEDKTRMIIYDMDLDNFGYEYAEIIRTIIHNHNNNLSSDSYIEALKGIMSSEKINNYKLKTSIKVTIEHEDEIKKKYPQRAK